MSDNSPLHLPLAAVGMSEAFTRTAMMYEYNTLSDILAIPLTELIQKEWFTTDMLEELAQVVKKHNIHTTPG
jgi:nicotinamide mononucleotide (NMN) deamidase PncC